MNEPHSPKVFPQGREEGRREFLVLLRLFFQNWDAPPVSFEELHEKDDVISLLSKQLFLPLLPCTKKDEIFFIHISFMPLFSRVYQT
ncbi:hypothetical protein PN497_09050 [Sphaerospermopsis kisseleviana CS-549]|uniref:Uncharacterized protein n=1 Tax=Sphaerospermopsis kisseleviana CS-549 TaxID=3021783 RepID=A0ABT4ZQ24_9CYAN|nr:hypothetical protein [Sphaerospermopsis kisseleviana CS-549]